jgi:hypothetical protein
MSLLRVSEAKNPSRLCWQTKVLGILRSLRLLRMTGKRKSRAIKRPECHHLPPF